MTAPERPEREAQRLAALRNYDVLDTPPERDLDDLATLAAQICETPIALISLVDEDRQWFKSKVGLELSETSRDVAFCGHAILQPDLLVVPDAQLDPRFVDNPLVTGAPKIRFYVGTPLVTPEGDALGTLCVFDRVPRTLDARQMEGLRVLGRQVMTQLNLRRQARDLAESEDRLLTVLRSCPVPISIHHLANRTFVDVSDAFTALLGWTREEVENRTTDEMQIVDPSAAAEVRALLISEGGLRDVEVPVRTRRGEPLQVIMSTELVDLRGEKHAITTFVDITARKRAESALKQSESRYRTLFECAPDGIVIADARSYYIDANASVCRMLGYSREEFIRLHASDIVAPAEIEHIAPALETIHSDADYHREWQFRRKDGSLLAAEVIATLMPDGNLLGMIRDVTERKRLEQHFLRAQRMEGIGTLAGGIAHDLNNILAPILLSVELLRESTEFAESLSLLDTVQASAERGAELVRQVLSYARGVDGQRLQVNPHDLVDNMLKVVRNTFPKAISVRLVAEPRLWAVIGDPTQLHQVFLNLCVNARDAMPGGGELRVSLRNLVVDESFAAMNPDLRPAAYVVTTVADTGTGIPPAIRDRIFEPFFTTKETGRGTGLGLSTTQAIVKSHGGAILLYSEVGRGSEFKVLLPACVSDTTVTGLTDERPALPRGEGELILLVDDEPSIRRIAQQTLEHFGYRVLLASDGAEAVDLYRQKGRQIAAVVTDMAMPVMDGLKTIAALVALNPGIRIIASSGFASSGGMAAALAAGALEFVPKPYSAETLLQALDRTLRGAG